MKPTFIYIGPDKCGSSWLYEILRAHPRCFVPALKDIYFFDRYYERGLNWYLSFFDGAKPDAIAVGELSHDYLFSPVAAERIARDLPDVRLVTTLRNPAERTFSHYLYMVRSGRTRLGFDEALERFPELINNSLYHKHLLHYFERFDRAGIKVLFFEKLCSDPRGFARDVFTFLGLPYVEDLEYDRRVLPAGRPRSHFLARLAKLGANKMRDVGAATLVGVVKRSPVRRLLYKPYKPADRPRLQPQARARLVERFCEDVERLEAMLQMDLQRWSAAHPEVRA